MEAKERAVAMVDQEVQDSSEADGVKMDLLKEKEWVDKLTEDVNTTSEALCRALSNIDIIQQNADIAVVRILEELSARIFIHMYLCIYDGKNTSYLISDNVSRRSYPNGRRFGIRRSSILPSRLSVNSIHSRRTLP